MQPIPSQMHTSNFMQQYMNVPNLINYKNVKCFYFERDKYCKYGKNCQYAHSDSDIKTPTEISYLNSIATAMNYQMNMAYGDTGNYSLEETQNRVNNYMQSMINNTPDNNAYDYQNYDYTGNGNYNTGDNYSNSYDYSYTPDTNYGNTGVSNSNYYDAHSNNYNQYAQYDQYSQHNYGYYQDMNGNVNNFNIEGYYNNHTNHCGNNGKSLCLL